MSDNMVGRSILQRVTHLVLRPQEPKLLTLVILHNISKNAFMKTLKNVSFAYNGLVVSLADKKSSLHGHILLTRRTHC